MSKSKYQPTHTCELEVNSTIVVPHSNTNEHNYTIGCEYVVHLINSDLGFRAKDPETGCKGNSLKVCDVYIKHRNTTKEELEEEKEKFEEEKEKLECDLESIESKLKFMEEHGLEEFDEEEYKVYKTLNVIEDDNKSRKEKAKEISKLIKDNSCSSGC